MPVNNSGNDIALEPVAVLGAGSWGTALAIQVRTGRSSDPSVVPQRGRTPAQMTSERPQTAAYLTGRAVSGRHRDTSGELAAAVKDAVAIIVAVPSPLP